MELVWDVGKAILKPWLASWFSWRIEGGERIPSDGGAILAANHISFLDPLALGYVVDRARRIPRFLAKSELFHDRRTAWFVKGSGQIEVRRESDNARIALANALGALGRGEIVCVFPEGTITRNPDLTPMRAKTGVARLAAMSDAPLLPCALWGTANSLPLGYRPRFRPGLQLHVRIGSPIEADHPLRRRLALALPAPTSSSDAASEQFLVREMTDEIMGRIHDMVVDMRTGGIPDLRRPKRGSGDAGAPAAAAASSPQLVVVPEEMTAEP